MTLVHPSRHVVVAVLTFRRPEGIAALLPALVSQALELSTRGHRVQILVVDNDPDASARDQVVGGGFGATYVHEPRPGIAAGRNRALSEAVGADAVVFVDDDEVPTAGWLQALVGHWLSTEATAVAGPVTSLFRHEVDPWLLAGGFFDRPRMPTGTSLFGAATNNLLLDLHRLPADLRFDQAFGLTGGSDTMLTHTLVRRGHLISWCDEAVVEEVVPPVRTTRPWVLRRALRAGTVWSRVDLALAPTRARRLLARLELSLRGTKRIAVGVAQAAAGAFRRDLGTRARGRRDVASGAGALLGAWGYVYTEYRRPSRG